MGEGQVMDWNALANAPLSSEDLVLAVRDAVECSNISTRLVIYHILERPYLATRIRNIILSERLTKGKKLGSIESVVREELGLSQYVSRPALILPVGIKPQWLLIYQSACCDWPFIPGDLCA